LLSRAGFIAICLVLSASVAEAARIKDLADVEGVRENQLIGYGLVIGLNGTGDKDSTKFTTQSLTSMLSRMGIRADPEKVKVKNVAAVVVTANLPPFARPGGRIDAMVSSIGDAKSLQGGTLLMTPLKGPDGRVYAAAQGAVSIGGFSAGDETTGIQKNHVTVGKVANGALVEADVPAAFSGKESFSVVLRQPDFTTALRVAEAVNNRIGGETAQAVDSGRIVLKTPETYRGRPVEFLAAVEGLDVAVDRAAKVVLNERTGTIVMGETVRLSTVAVSHGALSIEIKTDFKVSQPPPFSPGATVVVPETEVTAKEQKSRMLLLPSGATIGEVVRALNAVGVTPRDLISILQAIKAAGALHAELELI
jgi:flagellar P-ring protein precursor FlgI